MLSILALALLAPKHRVPARSIQANPPLRLVYEESKFLRTGRYSEAVSFCNELAKRNPAAKVIEYGVSPQGRKMIALIISSDKVFDPVKLQASPKPLIFVQNGIHSGEIEGKDASLILARQMLLEGGQRKLFTGANWVIVPVFSVDAHERFSRFSRINQNGPTEMGWRATAQNYNLNRDYTKLDSVEMKAQIKLINRFLPDFFFDNHTTDGADYQYSVMLGVPHGPVLATDTALWQSGLYSHVESRLDAQKIYCAPYFSVDASAIERGVSVEDFSARYSTGYLTALQRPSMLVETHMLKPYRTRVDATYATMVETVNFCIDTAKTLKALNREAPTQISEGTTVVLSSKTDPQTEPYVFKGWRYAPRESAISGGRIDAWTTEPVNTPTQIRRNLLAGETVFAPAAYAVPVQYGEIIEKLRLHGLALTKIDRAFTDLFSSYKFRAVTFPRAPFEGRFQPSCKADSLQETRTLPAGTVIVPVTPLSMQLLEPAAPDSFVRWGLFNSVFETKEYFEAYSMEPIAAKLMLDDAKLKAEFEEQLNDPAFAKSPQARLNWWFERSPYFDFALNKYPVVRLTTAQVRQMRTR